MPAVTLDCHFRCKGRALSLVNKLEILPLDIIERLMPANLMMSLQDVELSSPLALPGGGYRFLLPGAGKFRLAVDMFDETTPPGPGMVVEVPREGKTVTIDLPEPLLNVPPGTEVGWATRAAPREVKTLRAATGYGEKSAPVFGPRAALLAAWYTPRTDLLQVWHGDDGKLHPRQLRRAVVNMDAAGEKITSVGMYPLITGPATYDRLDRFKWLTKKAGANASPEWFADSHLVATPLNPCRTELPGVWSGRYFLCPNYAFNPRNISDDQNNDIGPVDLSYFPVNSGPRWQSVRSTLDIGEGAEQGISPHIGILDEKDEYSWEVMQRELKVSFEKMPPLPKGKTEYSYVLTEDGIWMQTMPGRIEPGKIGAIRVSVNTKSFSIYCPGAGFINDIPVPKEKNPPAIKLDNWQPGVSLSGLLLDREGEPICNKRVVLYATRYAPCVTSTDAAGGFTFEHLLPGPVCVNYEDSRINPGNYGMIEDDVIWPLRLPEGGLKGVTLAMRDTVFVGSGEDSILWWIPAHGDPLQLYRLSAEVGGLPPGEGTFWKGTSVLHADLQPGGRVDLRDLPASRTGGYLGLTLPIGDGKTRLPFMVYIAGRGKCAGQLFRIPSSVWFPSAELNQYLAQLGPLPPGDYTVIVDAPTGRKTQDITIPEHGAWLDLGK